jgi:hypothetical protein
MMHLRNRIEVCRVLVLIYRVPYTKGTKCIRRRYHVQIHRTNLPDKCRSPSLQSNSSSKLPCLISQSSFNWPKSNLPKIHVPDEVKHSEAEVKKSLDTLHNSFDLKFTSLHTTGSYFTRSRLRQAITAASVSKLKPHLPGFVHMRGGTRLLPFLNLTGLIETITSFSHTFLLVSTYALHLI